jgi:hypothetical protein
MRNLQHSLNRSIPSRMRLHPLQKVCNSCSGEMKQLKIRWIPSNWKNKINKPSRISTLKRWTTQLLHSLRLASQNHLYNLLTYRRPRVVSCMSPWSPTNQNMMMARRGSLSSQKRWANSSRTSSHPVTPRRRGRTPLLWPRSPVIESKVRCSTPLPPRKPRMRTYHGEHFYE